MKKSIVGCLLFCIASAPALARDDVEDYSVKDAMSIEKVKAAIGDDISFYFGNSKHPKIEKKYGEYQSNKKTNAFGKSDTEACHWAFASAMKTLAQRARREGGNAVVNIRSNYKGNLTSSNKTFQCGAGAVMAGVTLIGDVVKIKK